MKHSPTRIIFLLVFAIILFGAGYRLGEAKATTFIPQTENGEAINFDTFWSAWSALENRFVDKEKLDEKKQYYGAIKGMVSALGDPYTFFLTPEEHKQSQQDLQGNLEGIGAQLDVQRDTKFIIVVKPLKNSPAEKAGLSKGDIITKVNGESVVGLSLQEVVNKIRGPEGTKVTLTIVRNKAEQTLTITRAKINIPTIELTYEKKAAHLKLNQFGEETTREWDKAVDEIKRKYERKEIVGMVLDLRDNPGGYLDASVYLASEFLPKGEKVVIQEGTSPSDNKTYTVTREGRLLTIPLVVLVNGSSASASEIVAGALKSHSRAKLVGEKTFGKGSVQEVLNLPGDAGIHITIAKWKLPNGDWIHEKGIMPDIEVKPEPPQEPEPTPAPEEMPDVQYNTAIETLLKDAN